MAIATGTITEFENASTGSTFTVSNLVVPAGTDRLLVVRLSLRRGATSIATATASYNSSSMTEAVTQTNADATYRWRAYVFYLLMGSSGSDTTADLVITGNVALLFAGVAQTLTGVSQTTPLGVTGTDTGTDAQSDVALSTLTAGSYSVGIHGSSSTGSPTWTWTNVTEDFDFLGASGLANSGAYYANASASSVTFTGTRSASATYAAVAAEFLAAPSAGSLVPPRSTAARVYLRL